MHPAISMLPCDLFYHGKLGDGVTEHDRPAPPGFPWPRQNFPVAMINVEGHEQVGRTTQLLECSALSIRRPRF